MNAGVYRGRFAPSPTGPLHFGSLIAAVASYLDARANHGEWLVRIEDIDRERCRPEWADDILRTLAAFGFEWDGEIVFQSRRTEFYRDALDRLTRAGMTYPCGCSRREIGDSALPGIDGAVYPGTCRNGLAAGRTARAIRIRTSGMSITFNDAIRGTVTQDVAREIGDFVVRRADGPFAYQLAVVVDDAQQGITHVVRGGDLLLSTPRQIGLQRALGYTTPGYAHLPVAVNARGDKLSKQTGAAAVDSNQPGAALCTALAFLDQPLPAAPLPLHELWQWAISHWQMQRVFSGATITVAA